MKFLKDKQGNKLTVKEYIARWKKGIDGITPLQRVKSNIQGTSIMLIGQILGLIVVLLSYPKLSGWTIFWLSLVLFGTAINSTVQLMALIQSKRLFQTLENLPLDLENNTKEEK